MKRMVTDITYGDQCFTDGDQYLANGDQCFTDGDQKLANGDQCLPNCS